MIGRKRRRLNQGHARVSLHHVNHADQRFPRHDAVRIEHDHVAIAPAPAVAKILQVAAFAGDVLFPISVEDSPVRIEIHAHAVPVCLFLHPAVGIAGIAQDQQIEIIPPASFLQGLPNGAQPGRDPGGVLVVDRHDQRRPQGAIIRTCAGWRKSSDRVFVATPQQHPEAQGRGPERCAHPQDQQGVKNEQDQFGGREPVLLERTGDHRHRQHRGQHHQRKEQDPAKGDNARGQNACGNSHDFAL